ncbi:hypothetical protein BS47DRAFT_1387543 [Hydnum rufescens UP504]|uniref:Uncharacterized protein n=1 Tax=Hydnum rufescens UP504 TaxID=1448309 RepID=A0A9P6BAC9_9AGAM|nr:hypothetical protein BS47DRAFT_1387543 [Hydnum rufescens UP504]
MDKQIGIAHQEVLSQDPIEREAVMSEVIPLPKIDVITPITHRLYVSALSSNGLTIRKPTASQSVPTVSHGNLPSTDVPNLDPPRNPRLTPSDYIHSRCPLCAGAGGQTTGSKLPELFICIDACFALRQNKDYDQCPGHKKQPGVQDPRSVAPGTREVPRSFLEAWKARVKAACSMQHEGNNAKAPRQSNKGDMWTPGEQQFYAFTLIDAVMAELPEHWRKKGFHAVEKILAVRQRINVARDLVRALQQQLVAAPVVDSIASRNEIGEIMSAIAEQEKVISHLSKQDEDMMATLQLGDPVSFKQLQKMKHHAWFEHQLNMHALKAWIIARVCEKNFETHNLTGAFRIKAVDHSTLQHTSRAIKHHYQSVKGLVAEYNKCRESMKKLRGHQGIPRNALIPPSIDMKGLFSLDVDNDIWQDIGLADDEFDSDVPPWLGDEMVRNGIQLVQDIANCQDELKLCWRERHSLEHWFDEESAAMMTLLNSSTDSDMKFFLLEHLQVVCNLGQTWGRSLDALVISDAMAPSLPARHPLSHSVGLLAEQIQAPAHARPQQSDRPRKLDSNGIESNVDSSDDDEDLELEPAPVLADMDILAASDLICQQCSDDGASDAGSSDWDSSIDS